MHPDKMAKQKVKVIKALFHSKMSPILSLPAYKPMTDQ